MSDNEAERLASILVDARNCVTSVDGSDPIWRDLDADLAARVGAAFARQVGATGSPLWKLGAVDEATQRRLGVEGPLFAQLPLESVSSDVTAAAVDLCTLVAPRFEAEIGVLIEDGVLRAMPCVEVADSRFTGWSLPPWGVVADGTLQGRMLFGPATDPFADIEVTVRLDGEELGHGAGSWAEAAGRLNILPPDQPVRMVATGSLTALYPCTPGSWSFDFGPLGEISVRVV